MRASCSSSLTSHFSLLTSHFSLLTPIRSLLLLDAQVAAEGLEVDLAVAGADARVERTAGAALGFDRLAEVAAQVAAETAGVQLGRGVGRQAQLHIAAHAVDVDAAAGGQLAGQLHVAGDGAQGERLPRPAAGLD